MKIAINGGHCPNLEPGACSENGLQEAAVTHDIMNLAMYYLQQKDYEVLMIQENELQDICDLSNDFGADLFISIHCNSAENRLAKGTETFCLNKDSEAGSLARCIQDQIITNMDTVDRGVKTAGFYVLRHTDCPAVLVETAFISNSEDEELLASEKGKDDFALAIVKGIIDYVAK